MRADIDIDIGRHIIAIQVEKSVIRAIIPIPAEQGVYPFLLGIGDNVSHWITIPANKKNNNL